MSFYTFSVQKMNYLKCYIAVSIAFGTVQAMTERLNIPLGQGYGIIWVASLVKIVYILVTYYIPY